MNPKSTNPKIMNSHLSRMAVIYVRQSSKRQVAEHTASGAYQRSLTKLASQYGWPDELIVVVDQDQGRSGTTTAGREGFIWLRQQTFEENVGAIICWDASRIARDNAALAQLVKLCAATNTLIIDEKGVYDPNNDNDRIFLGLINVMADAEGRRIVNRSKMTKRNLAESGKLRLRPPTGYVYDDEEKKFVLDPNEDVQNSFRLFFSKYDELRTAHRTVQYFNQADIKFPVLERCRGKKSQIKWVTLINCRALYILHSPVYAGAYVWGLSKAVPTMLSADSTEQKQRRINLRWDSGEVILELVAKLNGAKAEKE